MCEVNKREAKKVIYEYLVEMLDPVNYGGYIVMESDDNEKDFLRLLEAVDEVQQELMKRVEKKRVTKNEVVR